MRAIFRPAEHTERAMLKAILTGVFPPGSTLPAERQLAVELGVTRPTLRETLQRLGREGWLRIRHGKPTEVRDYMRDGGLSILRSLTQFPDLVPVDLVPQLLEFRIVLLPPMAALAAQRDASTLLRHLSRADSLDGDPRVLAAFDWQLHLLMARGSGNPIYGLILNDFTALFELMGEAYFSHAAMRDHSIAYYAELETHLEADPSGIAGLVHRIMVEAAALWRDVALAPGGRS